MPRSRPVFQNHHAIEQQTLERSQLLKALSDTGHFDIHAAENRISYHPILGLRRL
ncbi:hypothetical protein [Xanthomonas euvesicatoria]|uniref:hypothetical protein n=1 Tax=Xanthomonas euvesicatoria TaxID=456327 RepID=UPI00030B8C88